MMQRFMITGALLLAKQQCAVALRLTGGWGKGFRRDAAIATTKIQFIGLNLSAAEAEKRLSSEARKVFSTLRDELKKANVEPFTEGYYEIVKDLFWRVTYEPNDLDEDESRMFRHLSWLYSYAKAANERILAFERVKETYDRLMGCCDGLNRVDETEVFQKLHDDFRALSWFFRNSVRTFRKHKATLESPLPWDEYSTRLESWSCEEWNEWYADFDSSIAKLDADLAAAAAERAAAAAKQAAKKAAEQAAKKTGKAGIAKFCQQKWGRHRKIFTE